MKNNSDSYSVSMWLGSIILIVCGLFMMIYKYVDLTIAVMVLGGILLISSNFFAYIGTSKPQDERLRKIGTLSATYSWYITLSFICFFIFTGYVAQRERKTAEILGVIILIMVISMVLSNTLLRLRGDVE